MDEATEFKELQKELRATIAPLVAITKITPSSADGLEKLASELDSFGSPDSLHHSITPWHDKASAFLRKARSARVEAFRRFESAYIRGLTEKPRQSDSSWRIGRIELVLKRETGRAAIHYNRQVVVPWKSIAGERDLAALVDAGEKKLSSCEIKESELAGLFTDAYHNCASTLPQPSLDKKPSIPIKDFYREVRVCLVRLDLRRQPDVKIKHADFPLWAFLYNLDGYRKIVRSLPADQRLTLDTGSQREISKGLAVTIGGLEPSDEYRSICYIKAS